MISDEVIKQVKHRLDVLANAKSKVVLDMLNDKREPYTAYMTAIKVRLPLSSVQRSLNKLVECEFVEKVEHYKGAKYSVNIEEISGFYRFLKIFKNRDWNKFNK